MQRRDLLKSAVGLTILRSGMLKGQNAPSNRLNIALMGVWGRGTAHYNVLRGENVVALCDVNDNRTKEALAIFPKAKTYWDWREMPRPEGYRSGGHLHRRSSPRVHRQLGDESRPARLLRKAAWASRWKKCARCAPII